MNTVGLRAGVGRARITPPVGLDLSGWCFGPSVGVHDDLYAKTLVLSDGVRHIVFVTADLIGLGTDYARAVRERIAHALGTAVDHVMIACSHTHSGPGAMPLRRWGTIDDDYIRSTMDRIVDTSVQAAGDLQPVTARFGTGRVSGICVNRRGDRGNTVDESLPLLWFDRRDGRTAAVVMNYSCHPVAAHGYRNLVSADFPGFAMGLIENRYAGARAMFTLGAAGDVNPCELHDIDFARRYGEAIAEEAVRMGGTRRSEMNTLEGSLEGRSRVVSLPVRKLPSASRLRREGSRWRSEAERLRRADGPYSKIEDALIKAEWAEEAGAVVEAGNAVDHLEMEIQAIRLGTVALLALPAELFVEIGIHIKQRSPFANTIIVTLANGALCYLPTTKAFTKGGYETEFSAKVYGLYTPTADAQQIVERAADELLSDLVPPSDRLPRQEIHGTETGDNHES